MANRIYKSKDLFLCPRSPMIVRLSIEVLDKPKERPKNGCKSCNEIATRWLLETINKAFAATK